MIFESTLLAPSCEAPGPGWFAQVWSTILACSGARVLALSLMEARAVGGHDGTTLSTVEVVGDARCAGFV